MTKRKIFKSSLLFLTAVGVSGCSSSHVHTYAKEWTCNAEFHAHSATCGCLDLSSDEGPHTFGNWVIVIPATEDTDGLQKKECGICRYSVTEVIPSLEKQIQEHVHTFETTLTKTPNSHYYAATCEHIYERKDNEEHSYGDWTIDREATTSTKGLKSRVCSVCSYKDEVVIPRVISSGVNTTLEYVTSDYYGGYYYDYFYDYYYVCQSMFYINLNIGYTQTNKFYTIDCY